MNKIYLDKNEKGFPQYFDVPTQVAFIENSDISDDRNWKGGIAIDMSIICGECGSAIELDDVQSLIVYPWISISDAIIGEDALPIVE